MQKISKISIFVFYMAIQILVTVGLGVSVSYGFDRDLAPSGLSVGTIDLGGYSQDYAWNEAINEIPTAVVFNDQIYDLTIVESKKNIQDWLEKQYKYEGSSWPEKVSEYIRKYKGEKNLSDPLLENEIIPQLQEIKKEIDRPAQAARFTDSNGQLRIIEEVPGYELNLDRSWQILKQSYTNQPVPLVVESGNTRPTKEDLALVNDVLGAYVSYFDAANVNKKNNIRLAANSINNSVIAPDEVFSFNRTVGERTETFGYKKSKIYVGNNILFDIGGGVCQNSSTLYQAVLRAHLPIIERHSHSMPVNYVPAGGDATVSYGQADFRFKNDTQYYLLIRAKVVDNRLEIQIIGSSDNNHQDELSTESNASLFSPNNANSK